MRGSISGGRTSIDALSSSSGSGHAARSAGPFIGNESSKRGAGGERIAQVKRMTGFGLDVLCDSESGSLLSERTKWLRPNSTRPRTRSHTRPESGVRPVMSQCPVSPPLPSLLPPADFLSRTTSPNVLKLLRFVLRPGIAVWSPTGVTVIVNNVTLLQTLLCTPAPPGEEEPVLLMATRQ